MKKLILSLFLGLCLIGCTAAKVGEPFNYGTKTAKFLTENYLRYQKDTVTLDEYYSASSLSRTDSIINPHPDLQFNLEYYPKYKQTLACFPSDYFGYDGILKGILISNGKETLHIKITNLSNIGNDEVPNKTLTLIETKQLFNILKSQEPIIIRVYKSQGYYDLKFLEKFRPVMIELLEVSLNLKTYNTAL
jgi:hypothetical protein|nr:MAG TPA_asm: outer membrane protein assembly factor [Caudoviricetes sp.]